MKNIIVKISEGLKIVFGYGILISLFLGGLTFFGYVAALIIGGETAVAICAFIYKGIYPYLVKFASVIVIIGLIKMYLSGESALSAKKSK